MNLFLEHLLTFHERINNAMNIVDEHFSINEGTDDHTLQPGWIEPKNYKIDSGYKAIVQDKSSDYIHLIFKNGKTVGRREIAF